MESSSKRFKSNVGHCDDSNLLRLSDGTLRTEDGCSFSVHKYKLAKASKYFLTLFCSMEQDEEEILIPSIKGENLNNILCYLYTGNLHVTENNIIDLMRASDYLLLGDLPLKLQQHLRENLTLRNSLPMLEISLELNREDISRPCFRFIQTHFENIVRCADCRICELSLETLKLLIGDKNLRVTSENIVWLSIIKWVETDTHNRLPLVPHLLKYLAISDIDENIANEILQHDIVANNPSCQEIYQGSSLIPDASNLTILKYYFQTYSRPMTAASDHRQPSTLNLIIHINEVRIHSMQIQVYLTYDENIDLWRNSSVIDVEMVPIDQLQFLVLNDCLYLFEAIEDRILYYSITENQWNEIEMLIPRSDYRAVKLDGLLYILAGFDDDIRDVNAVEVYDSETGEWHLTTPMFPVSQSNAVTHNNIIYVLGLQSGSFERILFQAYDPASLTWSLMPSPSVRRHGLEMVVYQDMIYVIGGKVREDCFVELKDVEVFDPNKNEWRTEVSLPYAFSKSKAITLKDKLIVCDIPFHVNTHINTNPPVQWNVSRKCWENLETSTMGDLHEYFFLTLENSECINIVWNENKDPATQFEYSPFSKCAAISFSNV